MAIATADDGAAQRGQAAGRPGFTVLVADDDPGVRSVVARCLERDGHHVILAQDGTEALARFEAHGPDVVVCDIRMPGLDGISLLERIRQGSPETEVVLVTGFADTGLVIDALRRGASNFVEKPLRPSELLRQLEPSFLRCGLAAERRRLQDELEVERERLEMHQRMATMGRLLAGLAHEVNNPLTFLKGNAELLRRLLAGLESRDGNGGPPDPDLLRRADALLGDMERGARRIEELVTSMRRFGCPGDGVRRRVSLARLMADSLDTASAKRDATTRVAFEPPPPEVWVDADPLALETCFVNLLVNAYEAVQAAGSRVRFAAELVPYVTESYRGLVEVSVEDDGPGIPQGLVDEVFTPFFTRKHGGMGLGLSIAYEAAKRHDAQIEIHTAEERGARVVVRLPYGSSEGESAAA